MSSEEKEFKTLPLIEDLSPAERHKRWAAYCPECGDRRMLWPIGQAVSSLEDPKAKMVHMGTGMEGCC